MKQPCPNPDCVGPHRPQRGERDMKKFIVKKPATLKDYIKIYKISKKDQREMDKLIKKIYNEGFSKGWAAHIEERQEYDDKD